jgi:hypothetical protein
MDARLRAMDAALYGTAQLPVDGGGKSPVV